MKEYVVSKLNSGQFILSKVTEGSGVSLFLINKVKNGEDVKQYILTALHDYFKSIGE